MKEWAKTSIVVAVGFGLAFLILMTSPSFQACVQYHDENGGNGSPQEYASLLVYYRIVRPCLGEWLHKNGDALIALFTIILGIATWLLWRATQSLVKGAEKTAERQLRAYVFLENAFFETTGADTWAMSYRIKNFGQTPAHKVKVAYIAKVVEWKGEKTEIPQPDIDGGMAFGSMAPSGDFVDDDVHFNGECSLHDLNSRAKAIYLVGVIKYIDVFEVSRWTRFQYYFGGDVGTSGKEMFADDKGNDAN
jgi:hypothetical protein